MHKTHGKCRLKFYNLIPCCYLLKANEKYLFCTDCTEEIVSCKNVIEPFTKFTVGRVRRVQVATYISYYSTYIIMFVVNMIFAIFALRMWCVWRVCRCVDLNHNNFRVRLIHTDAIITLTFSSDNHNIILYVLHRDARFRTMRFYSKTIFGHVTAASWTERKERVKNRETHSRAPAVKPFNYRIPGGIIVVVSLTFFRYFRLRTVVVSEEQQSR